MSLDKGKNRSYLLNKVKRSASAHAEHLSPCRMIPGAWENTAQGSEPVSTTAWFLNMPTGQCDENTKMLFQVVGGLWDETAYKADHHQQAHTQVTLKDK